MYQTKYRVVKLGWDYQNPTPTLKAMEGLFSTEEEALKEVTNSVHKELQSLNKNRTMEPVYDSDGVVVAHDYPFRSDEDGDHANLIRFWDGDDYQMVSQYDCYPVQFFKKDDGTYSEHSCMYRGFEIYSNPQHNRYHVQNCYDDFTWVIKYTLSSALSWIDQLREVS